MLKKRLIFTLLFSKGYFWLSRNFRLQKVGDMQWLKRNYGFSKISNYIDELIILNVSEDCNSLEEFNKMLKELTKDLFIPIAAGGGIREIDQAKKLLRSGADKIVLNTILFEESRNIVLKMKKEFGQQSIVASIDIKKENNNSYKIYTNSGKVKQKKNCKTLLSELNYDCIGEILLHSIDKDGTGQGYDIDTLELIPSSQNIPIIISGGAGNASHLIEGLENIKVDAANTSHLFNFVGDGLKNARESLMSNKISLASWISLDEFNQIQKEV